MSSERMTVLIIDDSKLSRNLLKHYIFSEYEDLAIIEETNGANGLKTYFEQKPALTFLDLTMPEMNGFEFLEKVKGQGKIGTIAVLSADVQEIHRTTALGLGADHFITKPIKTQLLKINSIVDAVRSELGLSSIEFEPRQMEAIAEIFNIGTGRAASSLSKLTGQAISLSVPEVKIVERSSLSKFIRVQYGLKGKIVTLQQGFKGDFLGYTFLLFNSNDLQEMIRLIVTAEAMGDDFEAGYKDAVLEIGNIVSSACIGAFGTTVETPLMLLPPSFYEDETHVLANPSTDTVIMRHALVAAANLNIRDKNIEGVIVLVISVNSMRLLLKHLEKMMGSD